MILDFIATVTSLDTDDGRKFPAQIPVRGRDAESVICEFQKVQAAMTFERRSYSIELQAQLDRKLVWETLSRFKLHVNELTIQVIQQRLIAHENSMVVTALGSPTVETTQPSRQSVVSG